MSDERAEWLAKPANEELSKKLKAVAWVLSAVVLLLVAVMQKVRLPLPEGWDTSMLPPFHAAVNAAGAVVLEGTHVKSGSLFAGVPAKFIKPVSQALREGEIERIANNYTRYSSWFK